ncbi:hypothetical protein K2173_025933 [Erythroxylum novogranatense]|uniref:Pentatricopeptide repeat-containing protein n=1 Tax=Erythroxylum novogranatense TaxID=1862640 RepID=A0AAV8SHU5_9ROSI|nr:hypothetical protein K2173_025933 [Erythroxylum novogranatense]
MAHHQNSRLWLITKLLTYPPKLLHGQLLHIVTFSAISTLPPSLEELPTKILSFAHLFQECSKLNSLKLGKQAHACMIVSGVSPMKFTSNCLIQFYIKTSHLDDARNVFDKMILRDVVSYNSMIAGYASHGKMGMARTFFDLMPERDVVSWNSMISGFLRNDECGKALIVFLEMGRSGVKFDRTTFAVVLKSCAVLGLCDTGVQIHGLVIRMGYDNDVFATSALVDMYAKCKELYDSLCVFSEMSQKNWVSWSALIAGCVQNNQHVEGLELFKEMQNERVGVSQSVYASVFRSCAGLSYIRLGSQLHAHALKSDFGSDIIVGTATLDMYAKCGSMLDAQKLFNSLPNHSLQSYNAIIIGFARSDKSLEALQVFRLLMKSGLVFDEISLSGAFSACASIKGSIEGHQVHGLAIKTTLRSNVCVANAMLDMYGKCGALHEAFCVFDEMETRDAVSWNAIISAHEQNGSEEQTLSLFASMLRSKMEPDEYTYGSVLKACAAQQALNTGMEIHDRIIKSGMGLESFIGGALVDMYGKCGMIEEAIKVHHRTREKTMVSWNAIISGFSLLKQSEDAQKFYSLMLETGMEPDNFTYAAVLDTCANLATIGLGKQIHAHIIKLDLQSDVYISSTLVDMYSKCGSMENCRLMFEKAPRRDFVTWNAMICGYANHGLGEEALKTFERMKPAKVNPNHATFLSVLRACVHMGLLDKGLYYFDSMLSEHGLEPQAEHYACMVDILGRAGRVGQALKLIEEMPFEADAVIWKTLLGVCKIQGNVEIAEKALAMLLHLDPQDSSAYILLSNIYADSGMWDRVAELRKIMKYKNLRKEPGCSWIEVKDEVHTFLAADKSHPRCEEIYEKLDVLIGEIKWAGYLPHIDLIVPDEEAGEYDNLEEQETCIYSHSSSC